MYRLALVYESGKRYIVPFEILTKIVKISDEDLKKIETEILKEIHQENAST